MAGNCTHLVTFNVRHFVPGDLTGWSRDTRLGFRVVRPSELLVEMRETEWS
ncbi:MAG: hypothetical protein GW893_03230 [Armatimonadetes bacterium]|nr:hypothetical protein [Armatimonadota bacterium]